MYRYIHEHFEESFNKKDRFPKRFKGVPRAGLEPATYPLGGDCAIQLCHRGEPAIVVDLPSDVETTVLGDPVGSDRAGLAV